MVLGISGAPGVGKTTFARALVEALGGPAAAVVPLPMDGFHLADVELERIGRRDAKGAPDTFDSHGYAATLERLRTPRPGETVYAPAFERDLDQPLAGAVAVEPGTALVVTEGNYLLLDGPGHDGWVRARAAIDEVWHVALPDDVRRERLLARHVRHGRTPEQARAWMASVDDPNALLVAAAASRADRVVVLPL